MWFKGINNGVRLNWKKLIEAPLRGRLKPSYISLSLFTGSEHVTNFNLVWKGFHTWSWASACGLLRYWSADSQLPVCNWPPKYSELNIPIPSTGKIIHSTISRLIQTFSCAGVGCEFQNTFRDSFSLHYFFLIDKMKLAFNGRPNKLIFHILTTNI